MCIQFVGTMYRLCCLLPTDDTGPVTQICVTGDTDWMKLLIRRNLMSWSNLKLVAASRAVVHCQFLPLIFTAM